MGWNESSAVFDPHWGTVDSSIEKHYHGQVSDIVWMTLSLQDGIGISALAVRQDVRPWHKSQIQPFNERGISTTMVASTQGDASITRTELGVGKVPENYSYCSSRACKYLSGHSRNTRRSESQRIVLTNTNARMALSSCSLFTELQVLSSCCPTPNYQLLLTAEGAGMQSDSVSGL